MIQLKLKFKSEIQCYFVENELMYVYEYTPSKYPDYSEPKLISLSSDQKKFVDDFAKLCKWNMVLKE